MAIVPKIALILSFLLLAACAEQMVNNKKPTARKTVAATPVASPKSGPSNVRLSQETNHNSEGTYYVQNRVLASGGVVSGALMGS